MPTKHFHSCSYQAKQKFVNKVNSKFNKQKSMCDPKIITQASDYLSSYLTTNVNLICRICLEKASKLLPIFDAIKPPHFSILIMACASVQVSHDDNLPQHICAKCSTKLNTAFQFKTQCEMAEVKFKQALENMIQIQGSKNAFHDTTHYEEENDKTQEVILFSDGLESTTIKMKLGLVDIATSETQIVSKEFNSFISEDPNVLNDTDTIQFQSLVPQDYIEYNSVQGGKTTDTVNESIIEKSMKPSVKKKEHSCHICRKIFRTKPSLVHHIRIHTGERPYVCNVCDKRFINGGHLHTHMRTHTGEKNHICVACRKAFATAQQLTKHTIAVHTADRPYACHYCTKKFASSSNLNAHTKIHRGEKNYFCDQCGKAFVTKAQLSQHMLVHTGEKAFMCEFCQKRFSQKAHLMRHLKTHQKDTSNI